MSRCPPRAGRIARRLGALEFLAVCDLFLSETAALADVVLPVDAVGRGDRHDDQPRGPGAAAPPGGRAAGGVRTDLEVIAALARRLDAPGQLVPDDPEPVFGELRRASAGGPADYAGISYQRIAAEDGVFWPCPGEDHPGTPRMFLDRFATPDGRARFFPVEHRPAAEDLDAEYPVYLTTGRCCSTTSRARRPGGCGAARGAARAVRRGPSRPRAACSLEDGERVAWSAGAARREGLVRNHRHDPPRHGVHAVPLGRCRRGQPGDQPGARPVSKMPEFKVCAVRLEAVP